MTDTQEPAVVYWLENHLYLNITNQCPNRCWFCFRNFKQGIGSFNLKLKGEPELDEVISALEKALPSKHWVEMVFCGFGEPTARLDLLLEVARWTKRHRPSLQIRLDTNGQGYCLNNNRDVASELKVSGVSKVSVSLCGHDKKTYDENCRPTIEGAFEAVLDFIRKAKACGLEVDVSAVQIPEVDVPKVKAVAKQLGVPFRFRDYIPCFW